MLYIILLNISCIGVNLRYDFIKHTESVIVFHLYIGDELSKNTQRIGDVEDKKLGMVQFSCRPDEPVAKIRLRVLQWKMVRRASSVEHFWSTS